MSFMNANMWFWLIAIFLIIEATTPNFVTIWFAFGAFAALLSSFATPNVTLQSAIFILVSTIAVIATYPFVKKMRSKKATPLNADRNIGRTAVVIEALTPGAHGRVRLDGVDWAAISAHPLAVGESCRVCEINSTVLTVAPIPQVAPL